MAHRRKKLSVANIVMGIGILIIFCAAVMIMGSKIRELNAQLTENQIKIEQLQKQIDAEKERAEQLKEEKKRVITDEYVEEVARDRLGLIYPGEVQFKEEGR